MSKEAERRKQAEVQSKNLKRRIGELEFLLEDEAQNDGDDSVTHVSPRQLAEVAMVQGEWRALVEGPRVLCLSSNTKAVWAGCSDGRLRCFSIAHPTEAAVDECVGGSVMAVCCVGDGVVLGGCADGTVRIWPGNLSFPPAS